MKNGILFAIATAVFIGILAMFFFGTSSTTTLPLPAPTIIPPSTTATKSIAIATDSTKEINSSSTNYHITSLLDKSTANNTDEPATSNQQPQTILPSTVLDNCRVLIHNYAARFGENPVGDNAEITAALRGSNPKQADFLREDSGLVVNEKGELVDAHGTPFFFHQVSAQVMEIRSAGEDKKFWTFDDQVTR